MPREVATGEGMTVLDVHRGAPIIIAFGGLYGQLLMPPLEFFSSLADLPVTKVFLRDHHQAWYQRGVRGVGTSVPAVQAALGDVIRTSRASRVVMLGTSAGGFAALLFGHLVGADRVVAFAPQAFLTRRLRLVHRDFRWKRAISAMRRHPRPGRVHDLAPLLRRLEPVDSHVFVGSSPRVDVAHAQRLAPLPQVTVHHLPLTGHGFVRSLRDGGGLARVLDAALEAGPFPRTDELLRPAP